MKKFLLLLVASGTLTAGACQTGGTAEATKGGTAAPSGNAAKTEAAPADPNAPVKFPFEDFAAVETMAKAGDYVLAPGFSTIQSNAGKAGAIYTFDKWKVIAPGQETTEVQYGAQRVKIPNAFTVTLPAGGTAKKGDVLLAANAGFNRAIVIDDATPTEPVVRYLDTEIDSALGSKEEKLQPGTFVRIGNAFDPGMAIAVRIGEYLNGATVMRVTGEKVLTKDHMGHLIVYDKKDCVPVPLAPGFKAGDKVQALRYGRYAAATVARVDPKLGRVFVKFDGQTDEKAIAFGNVLKA